MYAIGKTASYSIVLFNYRQHIVLLSVLFWYKKNCTAVTKSELLVFVVFAKRKPFKCTLCRFLLNIYGRKTPKYKKKAGLLTLYVGKSINLWRDWWIQINFWWYSNAKRYVLKMFVLRKILNVRPLKSLATACES